MFINLFRVFLGLLCISGLSLILFCMATNQNIDLPIWMQFALMGCFFYGLQLAIKSREVI
jgi:hypothetical protein